MALGWSAFLWIFQKNCIDISARSYEKLWLITFIFVNMMQHPCILMNNVKHSSKQDEHHFFIQIPINNLAAFRSILSRKPMSCCNGGINLVIILKYSFSKFVQTPKKYLRFRRFRRSYVHHSVVVLTRHCQICTAFFLLDVWCSKLSQFNFLHLFVSSDSAFA